MGSLLSLHVLPGPGTWTEQSCPDHQDGQASLAREQIERGTHQQCLWPKELEAVLVPIGFQAPTPSPRARELAEAPVPFQ